MTDQLPHDGPSRLEADDVPRAALFRKGLYTSLGVSVVVAAAAAVYTARDLVIRVFIALFVAISLDPIVRLLTRWRMPRGLAVFAVVVLTLICAAAFARAVIPTMVEQFQVMVRDLPAQAVAWQDRSGSVRQLGERLHVTGQVDGALKDLPARAGNGLFGATGRVFSSLVSALTVAVLSIYFLADLPRLRRASEWLSPRAYRDRLGRIAGVVVDKVGAYTIGNIAISVIAGVAAFAAMTVLRVPLALPLAFLVAVTDLIPSIGATLGAVICVIAALLTTHAWQSVLVLALFFVLYQLLENYLIAPRVMHGQVQLRPGAVLLATLTGAAALGLVGALMAIPIAAAVQVLVAERVRARDEADPEASPDGVPANGDSAQPT